MNDPTNLWYVCLFPRKAAGYCDGGEACHLLLEMINLLRLQASWMIKKNNFNVIFEYVGKSMMTLNKRILIKQGYNGLGRSSHVATDMYSILDYDKGSYPGTYI